MQRSVAIIDQNARAMKQTGPLDDLFCDSVIAMEPRDERNELLLVADRAVDLPDLHCAVAVKQQPRPRRHLD